MSRKPGLKEIDRAVGDYCAARGIRGPDAGEFRRDFGDFLEELKEAGAGGTRNARGDFTWDELQALLPEFHDDWR